MHLTNIVHNWAIGLGGITFIGIIYGWNYWCRGAISKWLVSIMPLQRTMPLREADLMVRVPLYGVPGFVGYIFLTILDPTLVIPWHFTIVALLSGVVLGIGVLAVGHRLSQFIYLETVLRLRNRSPMANANDDLAAFGDTGWLRGYNILRRTFPFSGYVLIAFAIIGEELIFRGIIFALLAKGFNPAIGIILSTLAFVGIQKMNMPTWSLALIPMTSALLMGIVHSYLALTTMNMLPLLVSHYTFFIASVLLFDIKENRGEEQQPAWYQQIRQKKFHG
jgi:membrane protease YdiL (CAAX protease family)